MSQTFSITPTNAARFNSGALAQFSQKLLMAAGLAEDRARAVAEVLLEGDLLGHTTHGLALLSMYLKELAEGTMEAHGEPAVVADHGSTLTWDGRYLPGPWLVREAIRVAQGRLADAPVATVVIRRSHHIACLQAYLEPVTSAGHMILLYSSDPASRIVAPYGGTARCYSPDPIAVGIPTAAGPILVDISTSTTALGVCNRWAKEGKRAPGPWLVDRDGHETDDPTAILENGGGAIQPLGGMELGYKGFGLGLMVEAMTSGLGGFGRADGEKRWGASVFLQLINPAGFGGQSAFLGETTFLAQACLQSPAAVGRESVRLPGQGALKRRAAQLAQGVELHPAIMPALAPWAERLRVSLPDPL